MNKTTYNITNIHQILDKNCVYILYLYDNIYKFGKSTKLNTRLSSYSSKLDYNNIVNIYQLPTVELMSSFENIIKRYVKEKKININCNINRKNGIEFFQTDNEKIVLEDLKQIHNEILLEYENKKVCDEENNSIVQTERTKQLELTNQLDLEKERTKQLEITEKTKQIEITNQIELEKTKQIKLEIKNLK
jgi:hypothetical protein